MGTDIPWNEVGVGVMIGLFAISFMKDSVSLHTHILMSVLSAVFLYSWLGFELTILVINGTALGYVAYMQFHLDKNRVFERNNGYLDED
jgi:hypothetical protein